MLICSREALLMVHYPFIFSILHKWDLNAANWTFDTLTPRPNLHTAVSSENQGCLNVYFIDFCFLTQYPSMHFLKNLPKTEDLFLFLPSVRVMCCMLNNSNLKYEWFIHNCGKSGLSFSPVLLRHHQKRKKKPELKEQWKDCGATDRAKAAADQE